jgi:hypothetical protein
LQAGGDGMLAVWPTKEKPSGENLLARLWVQGGSTEAGDGCGFRST